MIAMSIAGFDPSGGAGILNDIKTFHALGIYGTAVITAITAQNPKRVESIGAVSTDMIEKQIDTVIDEYPIQYGKTGMLFNPEIVKLVSRKINEHKLRMVVDPVMVAGCGTDLSVDGYARVLKKYLLPEAVLVTPNIKEAEILSNQTIDSVDDAVEAAIKIGKICDVVVTGGHLKGSNVIFDGKLSVVEGELIKSENVHGTGCSFSSAVASGLLKNHNIQRSVDDAVKFVKKSVEFGGWGTLNQFHDNILS